MSIPLRPWSPHPTAPSPLDEIGPTPIQIRCVEQDTPKGPHVDFLIVWDAEDAARCRFCKPGTCTFIPANPQIGTCRVRREGRLDDVAPLFGS